MKMNPFVRLTFIVLFINSITILSYHDAYAQNGRVELTPFGGYLLGGSIKFYEGKLKIDNNACYGGMLAVRVEEGTLVELSYTRMDSKADWRPYSGYGYDHTDTTIDVAMNYLQIGSVREFILADESVRPYGTFALGASWLHPKVEKAEDEWLFAVTAGLGLKYFFSERLGVRLQARLLLPLIFDGAGFYFGIGTGGASSGVSVSSSAPIVQGDFTGGLIVALGK